jgi:hypothetical protein
LKGPMLDFARLRFFPALVLSLAIFAGVPVSLIGQTVANRVVKPIDESQPVTLFGNVHPMARSEFDAGALSPETPLSRMVLVLEPSAAQQAQLDALVAAQHYPASPLYHQWLTPAQYGARFGVSAGDLAKVTSWLASHGFVVNEVPASGRLVVFSGTAGQVADTFHTEIHHYVVNGAQHVANAQDPQIPAALAGVVGGVVSLHDFRRTSQIRTRAALTPEYSSGSTHYLFPADWAMIYDLTSLYSAGTKGTGTSIAIVGRSNINVSDVTAFRSASGLTANNPTVILVSTNPGLLSGDQDESTLDVEWSGAVAPTATVKFVVGASTATSDGVDLSAQYIVNHAVAQVVSTSYGSCEQNMGSSELAFYNSLWQQAASQGMSAFVSSGDSGAAGCYGGSSSSASGAGVNGLCSSPYSTCVGGTEFNEGSNYATYWSATNTSSYGSALSYIPEKVWNESASDGGSGLWASGGGASLVYPQPSWQKGVSGASASNGMRAVPDVAMSASGHDGYIIYENGSFYVIAGTSAASPSLAGVMALVVQSKGGVGQGNANAGLYPLLSATHNPFHATPSGNNSVPGVTGFTASGASYNLATGLGSVDGALLVSAWGGGAKTTGVDFAMTASATSGTILAGKTGTFTVSVTESGTGKNAVALTAKAPTGVTVAIQPASITPGTTAAVTITVGTAAATGGQTITLTGSDASGTQTVNYALTVTQPPTLSVTAASSSVAVVQGNSGAVSLSAATGGSFTGNLTFSISGLPAGVTAAWSANPTASVSGVTSNKETLTLTASSAATVSTANITVSVAGDGLVASQIVSLQVQQAPGVTLATSPTSVSVPSLAATTVTVTATPVGGAVIPTGAAGSSISVASGLPKGFTAMWSAPSLASSGAVSWTLTLTGSSTAVAGTSTLGLTAKVAAKSGTTYTVSQNLPMTVTLTPPTLSIAPASSALSVVQGRTVTDVVSLSGNGTYAGAVSLSVSGLPSGVTATWSSSPVTLSNEAGSSTLTLTASSTAAVASATITVTASGDGVAASKQIALQVTAAPALQLAVSAATLSMTHTASGAVTLTVTPVGGLSEPVALAVTGLPAGVTAAFSKASLPAPGSGTSTLTFTGSSAAKAGTTAVTVTASGTSAGVSYNATQAVSLVLK